LVWKQKQDWSFHDSFKHADLRNLQPAYEYTSNPAANPCSSHLKESFTSNISVPVFRAVYWCAQKCVYPDKKEYDAWKEEEKQQKQLQSVVKKKGQPTKVLEICCMPCLILTVVVLRKWHLQRIKLSQRLGEKREHWVLLNANANYM
jgi:hypothetical protein